MGVVIDLLQRVNEILVDRDGVTYTQADGLGHLYDAELAVMALRADEATQLREVQLTPGTQQTLPDGAWRLRDAVINRGRLGNEVDGEPIRVVARGPLQGMASNTTTGYAWRQQAETVVREVMYDERLPTRFDVYPAMADDQTVIMLQVDAQPVPYPAVLDASVETTISRRHDNALIEWVLYRFLSRKSDITVAGNQGREHYEAFYQLLGITISADSENAVKRRDFLR